MIPIAYTAGNVIVKVTPSLQDFHKKIAKATRTRNVTVNVKADTGKAEAKIASLARPRRTSLTVDMKVDRALKSINDIQRGLTGPNVGLLTLMARATAAATALVALGGTANMIGALGAALAAASGAALLLPGAIGAGIAAAAALKLGFSGVGDAISAVAEGDVEKLNEALAKLHPNARAFVREIASLRSEFKGLQQSVQGALFNNLATPFREMATSVLPVLKSGLTGIADEFNTIARRAMLFFTQKSILDQMGVQFGATRDIVRNLGEAFTPLLRVFSTIAAIGLPILAEMTAGVGASAKGFAAFVASAEGTAKIEQLIRNGVTALGDMFAALGNIGAIVGIVFGAANTHGATFFTTLKGLTGELRTFLESARGQEFLTTIFTTLRETIDAVKPGLAALAGALIQIVRDVAPSLPLIGEAFTAVARELAPIMEGLGNLVGNILPPLATFIRDNAAAFAWLAVGIAGLVGTVKLLNFAATVAKSVTTAWTVATSVASGVQKAFSLVLSKQAWQMGFLRAQLVLLSIQQKAAAAATWVVTAAQRALNFAMKMNPIGLIVMAIMALVAGLIWAYNNIGWFRDGVNAAFSGIMVAVRAVGDWFVWLWQSVIVPAWEAIAAAFMWYWNNVCKPVFDALWFAIKLVGAILFTLLVTPFIIAWNLISAAFMWAWSTVIQPVLTWMGDLFNWIWANVLAPVFGWISAGWALLMDGIRWYYDNVLKPCWDALSAAAMWLWNNVLSQVFNWISAGWSLLMTAIRWYYDNILKPCWDALQAAALWLWNNVLKPVFDFIGLGWRNLMDGIRWVYDYVLKPCWDALTAAANWLWNNVLKPVFDFIGLGWRNLMDGIRWVYDNVLKPCFDAVKSAVDTVGQTFQRVADWIGQAWDRIKEATAAPIRFVVNTVINDGLLKGWNWIDGALGLGMHVEPIRLPFADGGLVPGEKRFQSGGRVPGGGNRDTVPAMLMPGEYVLSKKAVNAWGMDNIHSAHQAARAGRQHFAGGGPVHTWPHMWNLAQGLGVPVRKSSDYRPGDSGYHGKGQALDLVGNFSAIAQAIFDRFPHATQIISAQWRGGTGVLNGKPHYYANDNADHWDHVHWAMTPGALAGIPDPGGSNGGLLSGLLSYVLGRFIDPVFNMLPGGPPDWLEIPKRAAISLKDKVIAKITEFVGSGNGNGAVPPGAGPVMDQVRGVAARYGWDQGPQWDALVELVNRESSWNPSAANPTSSARGLFQKMTSIHGPVSPNPAQQAGWGLNYIRGRHVDPIGALAFHDRNNWYAKGGPVQPNLYDNGGVLPPTPGGYGLYANHSGKPEAVLTNEQLGWLRGAANGDRDGMTVNNNITTRVDASAEAIAQANTRHARHAFRGAGK